MEQYKERDKKSTFTGTGSHLVSDENLKDPTYIANAFNNFFTTITWKLNIQHIEKEDTISILKDSSGNFPSIKIIPITEADKNIP